MRISCGNEVQKKQKGKWETSAWFHLNDLIECNRSDLNLKGQ